MRYARISGSPRLRRLAKFLSDGRPHSSLECILKARVVAISSCVAELRCNGAEITCTRQMVDDRIVHFYTMTKGPAPAPATDTEKKAKTE